MKFSKFILEQSDIYKDALEAIGLFPFNSSNEARSAANKVLTPEHIVWNVILFHGKFYLATSLGEGAKAARLLKDKL